MTDVTDVKDLGSGVIGGKECDHLAFRAKDTDWQIWIAQGDEPYPCRYVITSKGSTRRRNSRWKFVTGRRAGRRAPIQLQAAGGRDEAGRQGSRGLKETSDLPENYRIGAAE